MHIDEGVIEDNRINPHKIDLMGRMGRSYYVRASGDAILSLYQSVVDKPIGYDALPTIAKQSKVLSGNDIGELAALTVLPSEEQIAAHKDTVNKEEYAGILISNGKVSEALAVLLAE